MAGAGAKEPRVALGAKRVFGGFREREGRGRARRLREALDLASFRAGEPTSRQGLRVGVGARRGGDGEGGRAGTPRVDQVFVTFPGRHTDTSPAVMQDASPREWVCMLYAVVLKHWFVCLVVKPSARRATTGTVIGFLFN